MALSRLLGTAREEARGLGGHIWGPSGASRSDSIAGGPQPNGWLLLTLSVAGLGAAELWGEAGLLQRERLEAGWEKRTAAPYVLLSPSKLNY